MTAYHEPEPSYWLAPGLDEPYVEGPGWVPFNQRPRTRLDGPFPTANLQSSLWDDGYHRPTLDIDVPMEVRPSSTPGHWHLIFPGTKLTWEQYDKLLGALVDAGIIEPGYHGASRQPGRLMTFIRTPWTRKNPDAVRRKGRTVEDYLEG